jgi:hypothetical protein
LTAVLASAADTPAPPARLTTLDGRVFTDLAGMTVKPDGVTLMSATGITRLPFTVLTPDIRQHYQYNPIEGAIAAVKAKPRTITAKSAFSLKQLDAAKAAATASGRPLGFIVTWDHILNKPANPQEANGSSDEHLAHYVAVYDGLLTLVFVRHEDELNKLPPGAAAGIGGPEAGNWSPKLAITTPDAQQLIVMVPYGNATPQGGNTLKSHQAVFRRTWPKVDAWYAGNPAMAAAREAALKAEAITLASATAAKDR